LKRIVIAVLSLLLLACVPTPDEEVVAGKSGETAALLAEESDGQLSELLSAVPSAWNDEFSLRDGTVTVRIDAVVVVPQVDRFPVVEVAPASIDPAIAAKLLNRLVPRGAIRVPNQSGQMYSVEDVDRWIDEVKALLAHTDEMTFASVEERDAYIDTQNVELERLFALRKTAEAGAVTTLDDYAKLRQYGAMQARVLDARGTECAELLWKPQSDDGQDKRESVLHIDALSPACALADHEVETVEEARQLADALFEEIGLSDRYVCVSVKDSKNWTVCYYGPTYGGITASPFTETVLDTGSYRAPWPNETLMISVNRNDGRTSASLVCPPRSGANSVPRRCCRLRRSGRSLKRA
jgi:hypothetical protein